ncbi:MAG: ABC transporter substrate-binding protein [Magnetospirillum sp. WYHS-4]
MTRSIFKRGAVAAAALLAFTGMASAKEPIKIGAFLSVTGPASFLGDPELKTLQMMLEEINKGGVLGRKVELVHYDTAGDAEKAKTAAKRLIDSDKVDVIVGGSTTGETMAVIPLAEEAGVPFISLAGGVPIVEPVKKWVFKTPHTDKMACAKIFVDMQKRGLSKVALISGTGGFGKSMHGECEKLAPAYGIDLVAKETYGPKDTDMTPQLTKIKGTAGVQAILNADFGQGPAIVTKNIKQLGIALPVYQSHGVASKKYIELAGDAAEGIRLPAAAVLVADKLAGNDPQKLVAMKFKTEFEGRFKAEVSTFGGHAFDGLNMALAAMARAGGTDKAKVRDEIEKTSGYIGTGGIVNMSPTDHMGLDLSSFRMLEIRKGDWTLAD